MSDDYSEHPVSLAEVRANRSDRAKDWAPRDALIETLRLIDSGQRNVESLVLVQLVRLPDGGTVTGVLSANADAITATGLLATAMVLRAKQ